MTGYIDFRNQIVALFCACAADTWFTPTNLTFMESSLSSGKRRSPVKAGGGRWEMECGREGGAEGRTGRRMEMNEAFTAWCLAYDNRRKDIKTRAKWTITAQFVRGQIQKRPTSPRAADLRLNSTDKSRSNTSKFDPACLNPTPPLNRNYSEEFNRRNNKKLLSPRHHVCSFSPARGHCSISCLSVFVSSSPAVCV